MHDECNDLAKLQPLVLPQLTIKRSSSYSVSSTAVPGGLRAYRWPRPSGLCQSQHTGREGMMSLCRSGKEQRCILQLKAGGLEYRGLSGVIGLCDLMCRLMHFFLPKEPGLHLVANQFCPVFFKSEPLNRYIRTKKVQQLK